MNTQISKGVTKGLVNVFELFQGLSIGYTFNCMYTTYLKSNNIAVAIAYIAVMICVTFTMREINMHILKNKIKNKLDYDEFIWPSPMLFGFGLFFTQHKFKKILTKTIGN